MKLTLMILNFLACASAFASTVPDTVVFSTVQYSVPKSYVFYFEPEHAVETDCSFLNKMVGLYRDLKCDTQWDADKCSERLSGLRYEMNSDNHEPGGFYRNYPISKVSMNGEPNTIQSKRFDHSVADSFRLTIDQDSQFDWNRLLNSTETEIENRLNIESKVVLLKENDQIVLHVESKFRACALEFGSLSLMGYAPIQGFGPSDFGPVGDSIADTVFQSGYQLQNQDKADNEKEYELGVAAGNAFKLIKDQISTAYELSAIGLSLKTTLIDDSSVHFLLRPGLMNKDSQITAILNPGYTDSNAPIKIINFKKVTF